MNHYQLRAELQKARSERRRSEITYANKWNCPPEQLVRGIPWYLYPGQSPAAYFEAEEQRKQQSLAMEMSSSITGAHNNETQESPVKEIGDKSI